MRKELLIVILNYNSFRSTIKCVNSIKAFNSDFSDFDIVVADNCSTDDSYTELKLAFANINNVTLIKTDKNGGYSYGNNYAIRYMLKKDIKYSFISIINPDVIFKSEFLKYQMDILSKSKEYSMISCLVSTNGKINFNNQSWVIPSANEFCLRTSLLCKNINISNNIYNVYNDNLVEAEILPGSFFIIKTDIFKNVGLFDENIFMYNEETILSMKLKEQGKKALLDLNHVYFHNHKKSSRKEVWEAYRNDFHTIFKMHKYFYNSRKYVYKHYYKAQNMVLLNFIITCNELLIVLKHFVALFKRD